MLHMPIHWHADCAWAIVIDQVSVLTIPACDDTQQLAVSHVVAPCTTGALL